LSRRSLRRRRTRALSLFESIPKERGDEFDLARDIKSSGRDDRACHETAREIEDRQGRGGRVDVADFAARHAACNGVLEPAGLSIDHRLEFRRPRFHAGDLARDGRDIHAEEVAVFQEVLRSRGHEGSNRVMQIRCPLDRLVRPSIKLGQTTAERRVVDALLRSVIEIRRPFRDIRVVRNLLHRCAIEPVFAEYAGGRVEQCVAAILGNDVGSGGPAMTVHSVK